jgi:hypothetical protein
VSRGRRAERATAAAQRFRKQILQFFFLKSLQLLSLSFLGWNSNVCKQEESIIWAKRPDSAAKWTRRSPLSVWTSPTAAISAIGPSHVQTNHAAHRCVCCSYKRLPSRG